MPDDELSDTRSEADGPSRRPPAEEDAARAPGESPQPGREPRSLVAPVIVPRWIQFAALILGALALWALARAAGIVLLIFIVAGVTALILNPLVTLIQRGRIPRGLAVLAVYSGFFLALGGGGVLLANPIGDQVQRFQRDVPNIVDSANKSLAHFQKWLDRNGIKVKVKKPGKTALQTLQRNVERRSGDLVKFTRDLLTKLVEAGFALILILVISVYMLLYADRIGHLVRSVMPPGDPTPEDDFTLRVQKAVAGYVRGQLMFSMIMGVSAGVLLWLFGTLGIFPDGRRYALFFGAFFGLMELVPYVGPVLGAIPPVLVALFQDPLTAVWVALLFLALQQLEGHVVAPQVFGHYLRINPLLVIFALLTGGALYGIVGAFVALPLAAALRETVLYLRRHLVLEPWVTPGSAALETGLLEPSVTRRCRECGAQQDPGDAFCRRCGAPQAPPVGTPS